MSKKRRSHSPIKFRNLPGIYAIVNTRNQHTYVGQSKLLEQREAQHFRDLRRNKHHNPYLQNAFNKYGEAAFTFVVLEYVPAMHELDAREQYWIDELKPNYNILMEVGFKNIWDAKRNPKNEWEHDTFDECILETSNYQRPAWHEWVYGGARNPLLSVRATAPKLYPN